MWPQKAAQTCYFSLNPNVIFISNIQVLNHCLTILQGLSLDTLFTTVISCPLFVMLVFNSSVLTILPWNMEILLGYRCTPSNLLAPCVKHEACCKAASCFPKVYPILATSGLCFLSSPLSFLSVGLNRLNPRLCKHCHQAVVLSLGRNNPERKQTFMNTSISSFPPIQTNEPSFLLGLKHFCKLIYYSRVGRKYKTRQKG